MVFTVGGSPDNEDGDADGQVFHRMMQRTMAAFSEAWGRGDIDGLMTLFGEDPTYRTSSGTSFKGRAELRRGLAKMCQPPADGNTPPAAPQKMQFFDRSCLSFWQLDLPNGGTHGVVDGVDVITFDDEARVIVKDAYRKLA